MTENIQIKLGLLLHGRNLTISTAESCTGGMIGHLLTSVAGSSAYYVGGVISYSNAVKVNVLGVNAQDIERYGAVSEQVVRQMADGAKNRLGSDCAVATSGVAGPSGGTPEKPVGTVWVAAATPKGTFTQEFVFGTDRMQNISKAAGAALAFLYEKLVEEGF